MTRRLSRLASIPVIFLVDLVSKIWVIRHFEEGRGVALWPGVFHLTRVNNTGAAFGLFKTAGAALTLVSIACVAVLFWFAWRESEPARPAGTRLVGLCLVIGGALGNFWDRIRYGYVVDFLDFRVWPVFNLADSAITVGMLILIAGLWHKE